MTHTPISSANHSHTYPTFVFDVDFSSFINEVLYCVHIVFSHCNIEGSLLTEKKKRADPVVL